MELEIDIYRRQMDLFDCIDEALEYIEKTTASGDFETALTLLYDVKDAAGEIRASTEVVLTRLGEGALGLDEVFKGFVTSLDDMVASYETANIEFILRIITDRMQPSLSSYRKRIIELVGVEVSS